MTTLWYVAYSPFLDQPFAIDLSLAVYHSPVSDYSRVFYDSSNLDYNSEFFAESLNSHRRPMLPLDVLCCLECAVLPLDVASP